MNKKMILLIILFILMVITNNDVMASIEIDQEVINSLNQTGTADVIVMLKDNSNMRIEGSKSENIYILKERGEIYSNIQDNLLSKFDRNSLKPRFKFQLVNGFSGEINNEGFEKLKSDLLVRSIRINRKFKMELRGSVPLINGGSITLEYTGNGQTICVVDSGVDYTHSDLGGCFGPGCKVVGGYNFYNSSPDPIDVAGHGTRVAGVVAANGILKGVAPDANIAALKVCDFHTSFCDEDAMM